MSPESVVGSCILTRGSDPLGGPIPFPETCMSDRALWAAFQKVRTEVEGALEETRKKEAQRIEAEEKRRREEKTKKRAASPAARFVRGEAPKAAPAGKAREAQGPSAPAPRTGRPNAAPSRGAAPVAQRGNDAFRRALASVRKDTGPDEKTVRTKGRPDERRRGKPTQNGRDRTQNAEGKGAPASAQKAAMNNTATDVKPRREERRLSYAERRTPVPPFELMPGLPVTEHGEELVRAVCENRVVIVCGETGSGKTTQLPKIAMMAGRGETGMIAHTQPRRIAASSVAKRIAEELKTNLGDVVGYKVRFTDKTHSGATIKLMTDGILLAETLTDPLLRAYDTVIIDEAHERSINIDFLLGYLKRLLTKRADLKVIVTSATIDAERFAHHFADADGKPAPIFNISGRTYPVEIRWRPLDDVDEADDRTMLEAIENAVSELEMAGRGDILVFLPGEREIRETEDYLRKTRVGKVEILPLFARLSASDQEKVFKPSGLRRIVLATNVAETSITVPGIRYVVDTGLARVKRYSYRSKVDQLLIEPVSQAAANQRAGRCGRVAEGICIRLYDEEDFARRPAFTDPEIFRTNLAAVILRAKALKLGDIREFPFLQAPPPRAIADGISILQELRALTPEGELTKIGRELSRLPVDPKLARMLLAGSEFGSLSELLIICSGLSVQDPRERPLDQQEAADRAHKELADERSDFLSFVKLWRWYEKAKAEKESNRKFDAELHRRFLSARRMREWRDVYRQLETIVDELGWRKNTAPATYEEVHRALLSGLLGNIGSKSAESDFRAPPYLGARGIKFWLWPGSVRAKKSGRWIFAGEIVETSRLFARTLADVEPEWIEAAAGDLVRRHAGDPRWEKRRGEVVASERGTLYGLTLYKDRSVLYSRYDAVAAREVFIREGLVPGEIETRGAFLSHNLRLVREIRELEHKTRRPDVLVDDEQIFAFYDEKLPADVCGTISFEAWRKEAEKKDPRLLYLSKEELMRHDATNATQQYYPKTLEMAGVTMALTYHFEPGSPRDGITLTVPVYALNQIDPVRCEWLVPGMVKEKAQALLKSLPQKIRRHCVPIADYAKAFYVRCGEGQRTDRGFLTVLAEDIRETLSVPCTASDFKVEQLPPHLIMNFRVVDEHGRTLEMGRSLAQLRAELGGLAQDAFQSVAQADESVAKDLAEGVTDWTFGELPELMEISRRGQTLIGHPALVDQGNVCSIEVFDDPVEAARAHRKGLRKLFRLVLREQVKYVERSLKDLGRVSMQAAVVPGLSRLFESADTLSRGVVDAVLEATALVDPLPTDEESFKARKEDVRGRLTLVAGEVARLLTTIVTEATSLPMKLRRFTDAPELVRDVEEQLDALFPPDFLLAAPLSQLMHYPRYLKAIHYRLDRYRDDPKRDAERQAALTGRRRPPRRARSAVDGLPVAARGVARVSLRAAASHAHAREREAPRAHLGDHRPRLRAVSRFCKYLCLRGKGRGDPPSSPA